MQKSKMSILNAICAMTLTIVNGVLGLVVTRLFITAFGSDFNGLNSTATQFVNMMLILEGGFTIAVNVAMFVPYVNRDFNKISRIIVAARNTFKKIGLLFVGAGTIGTIVYSYFVNTPLDKTIIFSILMMTFLPAGFNLYYTMKYRILLQAEQKEYIVSSITMLTITLGHVVNIILIYIDSNSMWLARFVVMICSLANSTLIGVYCKRRYKQYLDFSAEPDYSSIKGTNDVLIQKITGAIYSTLPIIFISISSAGGTAIASVYAVYNSVFTLLKSVLYAVTDAPRLGIGQTIVENDEKRTYKIFLQYELITIILLCLLMTSASSLIMPFIALYTYNVNDVNYVDYYVATILVMITLLEILHIPSGHLINMSGNFKVSRKFQVAACVILLFFLISGALFKGIYGILFAVFMTALSLAIMEIYYTHCIYFKRSLTIFWRLLLPNLLISICLLIIEVNFTKELNNYLDFLVSGTMLTTINLLIILFVNFIFNRTILNPICSKILFFSRTAINKVISKKI